MTEKVLWRFVTVKTLIRRFRRRQPGRNRASADRGQVATAAEREQL